MAGISGGMSHGCRMMGYSGRGVFNAVDAINAAAQFRPDTLLIDYHLGDARGTELAKDIQRKAALRKIIIVSAGHVDPAELESFDFLEKPFDLADLIRTIGD
jgi:DNA-binding response OmpR family regulator